MFESHFQIFFAADIDRLEAEDDIPLRHIKRLRKPSTTFVIDMNTRSCNRHINPEGSRLELILRNSEASIADSTQNKKAHFRALLSGIRLVDDLWKGSPYVLSR